jgi:membrane protease YdiL (CAAX protease family)
VLAEAAALGMALKLVMKALVMPLVGAPAVNPSYQYLAGNGAALPGITGALLLAGTAEELVYRGYVFERLRVLLGSGRAALRTSVLVSAAVFALAHFRDQGMPGVVQSTITGLVFAALFARRGQIWAPIIAHITFNMTSVALIYGSWEEAVARAVFR